MYFIPKDDKGSGKPPRKNNKTKRVLIILVPVFLLILALLGKYSHLLHPQADFENHEHLAGHPERIDERLLDNKDFGLPKIAPHDEIIRHFAYVLNYSEKDEEARWVAYTMKSTYLEGTEKRETHFDADYDVPTGSAEPDDYRNSGYDKGHLAPAADMKWSTQAMKESFLLSNVCPQNHKFNEGIWAELEKAVRKWAKYDNTVYIVTGPVLPADNDLKIGKDHVTVPSYFYKVIFSPNPYPKGIGFIIPNQPGTQSFWKYACSLSQVEKRTHLQFFPLLPVKTSKEIKENFDKQDWRTSAKFVE